MEFCVSIYLFICLFAILSLYKILVLLSSCCTFPNNHSYLVVNRTIQIHLKFQYLLNGQTSEADSAINHCHFCFNQVDPRLSVSTHFKMAMNSSSLLAVIPLAKRRLLVFLPAMKIPFSHSSTFSPTDILCIGVK